MRPITKIDIITRTEKLDELKVAFAEIGVTGMTAGRLTILTLCRRLK